MSLIKMPHEHGAKMDLVIATMSLTMTFSDDVAHSSSCGMDKWQQGY